MRAATIDRRLEAIAGPPVAQRSTPGTTWLAGALTGAVSLYVASKVLDPAWKSLASLGSTVSGKLDLNLSPAPIQARVRLDNESTGVTNRTFSRPVWTPLPDMVVMSVALNPAQTLVRVGGAIADSILPPTPGSMINPFAASFARLDLSAPNSAAVPLWCGVWPEHDQEVTARILRWLATRYRAGGAS